MGFTLVQGAAREAVGLIVRSPFRWIAAVLTFLVLSEGVMFIPYVGFLLKLLIGSLLAAGMIKLLEQAAGGEPPRVSRVFSGFGLPMGAKSTLFAGALIPFAAGIAYLYFRSGHSGIAYFFGNVLRDERPTPKDFQAFKTVMYTVATPLVFVAAAVVLNRLSGWTAFETAIKAAVRHWPAPSSASLRPPVASAVRPMGLRTHQAEFRRLVPAESARQLQPVDCGRFAREHLRE